MNDYLAIRGIELLKVKRYLIFAVVVVFSAAMLLFVLLGCTKIPEEWGVKISPEEWNRIIDDTVNEFRKDDANSELYYSCSYQIDGGVPIIRPYRFYHADGIIKWENDYFFAGGRRCCQV